MTRMRGTRAVRRAALVGMAVVLPGAAQAQPTGEVTVARRPVIGLLVGVAATSPLLVDGNGTTVRVGPSAVVGAAVRAPVRWRALAFGAVARLSAGAVRLAEHGDARTAGRAWQSDLALLVEWPAHPRLMLHAGGGAAWVVGPRDVRPFADNARGVRPAMEGGATWRPAARTPWAVGVTAQGFRVRPDGGSAGGVGRLLVLVRHGR